MFLFFILIYVTMYYFVLFWRKLTFCFETDSIKAYDFTNYNN